MDNAKSIKDLQESESVLKKAINTVESISATNALAVKLQEHLSSYRSLLSNLEKRLDYEQKAQKLFNEAAIVVNTADQALEQFQQGQTRRISQLNKIKAEYDLALEKLNRTILDYSKSLILEPGKEQIEKCDRQIGRINNEITDIRKKCATGDGIGATGLCLP
jgi:tetratricopeptide (TPR) repeat protein